MIKGVKKIRNVLLVNVSFLDSEREHRLPLALPTLENYLSFYFSNRLNIDVFDLGIYSFLDFQRKVNERKYDLIGLSIPSTHLAESALYPHLPAPFYQC